MTILREVNYGGGNNKILIIFASICGLVWIVGLGLVCGIVWSLESPELYKLWLLAFTAGAIGVLVGFVASIPSPIKQGDRKIELEGGMVSETGKWISSAIAGGSLTAVVLEGKNFLTWLAGKLNQSEAVVLLVVILFAILGFLLMYFTRRIRLNIIIASAQQELEMIVKDINTVISWAGRTLGKTPDKIPDEFYEATERLVSDISKKPFEKYEGLLAQGIALKLKGNLKAAMDLLERASKVNPTDYRVFTVLASAYLDFGNIQKAYEHIRTAESLKSQELDPGYLKIYAQISYAADEYKKAIKYYLQYLKSHPHDAEARFELARAYARYGASSSGDDEANTSAIEALEAAIQQNASLKTKAIEESKNGGAFERLADNEEFKAAAGVT